MSINLAFSSKMDISLLASSIICRHLHWEKACEQVLDLGGAGGGGCQCLSSHHVTLSVKAKGS